MSRARRGLTGYHAGLAAEAVVANRYRARGAEVVAERHRTPEGEIDLIVRQDKVLIFVEVKKRKSARFGPAITEKQWKRLENAALHYMVEYQNETGVQPLCRFDAALMGPDGSVQIIENARSFDEH